MKNKNLLLTAAGLLFVANMAHAQTCGTSQVTYSGYTSNYLPKWNATSGCISNSSIFDNGSVGIGTTSPFEKLHLHSGTGDGDTYNTVFALSRTSSTGNVEVAKLVLDDMDTNYGNLVFKVKTTASSAESSAYYTDAMTIKGSDGNVGIGTSTPGAKLEVAGQVKITGGTPGAGKVLVSDANGLASWSTVGANGGWSTTGNASTVDGTNFIGTTDNVPFNIRMNNQKAGRIDGTNTFLGYLSANTNSTGYNNTAVGTSALYSNTTGYSNTAFGYGALYSNTTGDENTASGFNALYYNTASHNTAYGVGALFTNTTGANNTATGHVALFVNTTGADNVANGYFALVGNTTGSYNTASGFSTLAGITTGNYNTGLGYNANVDNAARTNSITLAGNGNLALGGDNRVRIGNSSMSSIGGQVGWTTISDERVKENVTDNVKGLSFIMKLQPVTYNYSIEKSNGIQGKEDTVDWTGKYDVEKMRFSGFLSQEVEKAAKECNYNFSGVDKPQDKNGLWGLRYAEFTVPLVKAVQEQQQMIDSLKTNNVSLKNYMNQQDSVIAALKKQMDQFASLVNATNPTQSISSANLTDVELSTKNVVVLDQNVPNPFAEQTSINYFLPDNVSRAQIIFFDQSGKIIKSVDLTEKGKGTLNIFANDLSNGIYTYSLIVDGQTIETKKMLKAK